MNMHKSSICFLFFSLVNILAFAAPASVQPISPDASRPGGAQQSMIVTRQQYDAIKSGNAKAADELRMLKVKIDAILPMIDEIERLSFNEKMILCSVRESIQQDIQNLKIGASPKNKQVYITANSAQAVLKSIDKRIQDEKLPCLK